MIIFQMAGGEAAGFRLNGSLLRPAPATTFRNNTYIHRLNRTLQAEMRALSAYRSLIEQSVQRSEIIEDLEWYLEQSVISHQTAGRELVRLVVANRGIPEDRSTLSFGLTRRLMQVCVSMPGRLSERATVGTLVSLERQLVASYRRLINEAPLRDMVILEDLMTRAEKQARELSED